MQQFPQLHPSDTRATRLALAKFSYTTTSIDHVGPLTWAHVPGDGDISCVFQKLPGSSAMAAARLMLRVVQGNGILEQIDLTSFAMLAADQSPHVPNNSLSKPHFAIIVKLPCLAVKYPLDGAHIRRFQVKFSSDRDYYTALALLSEINCPFSEGATPSPPTARRLPSSSSWGSRPVSAATTVRSVDAALTPNTTATVPCFPSATGQPGMAGLNPQSSSSSNVPQLAPFNSIPAASHAPRQQQQPADLRWPQNNPSLHPAHAEPDTPNSRPSTAPAYHDIEQLNQMLPPKRDLPFSKPPPKRTRIGTSDQTVHQKRSSLPPPLYQRLAPENNQNTRQSARAEAPARSDSQTIDSQTQSPPPTQPHPDAIPAQPISPKSPAPRSGPEHHAQVLVLHEPSILNPQSQIHNSDNIDQNTAEAHQRIPPRPTAKPSVEDHLAMYLASPTPERIAFLENWMCELIEDDKFMTLCQDVEATWRRFAFGNRS